MKTIDFLSRSTEVLQRLGAAGAAVRRLTYDSRAVAAGDC